MTPLLTVILLPFLFHPPPPLPPPPSRPPHIRVSESLAFTTGISYVVGALWLDLHPARLHGSCSPMVRLMVIKSQ